MRICQCPRSPTLTAVKWIIKNWARQLSSNVNKCELLGGWAEHEETCKKRLLKIINLAGICHGTPATQRGSREREQWSQWPAANCLWKAHQPLIDFCWSDTCLRAGTKGRCEHLTAARRPRAPLLPRDEWPWAREEGGHSRAGGAAWLSFGKSGQKYGLKPHYWRNNYNNVL